MDKNKTKKIVLIVVGVLIAFAAGFGTSYLIDKINYTRSINRLGGLLGDGEYSTARLYSELEQRIREFDDITGKFETVSKDVDECSELAEQSGLTIGQLRSTVESIGTTSTNIGDTIKQLREGQQSIKRYVGKLEDDNSRLKTQLKELQGSISQQ